MTLYRRFLWVLVSTSYKRRLISLIIFSLCSITITTRGKYLAMDCRIIPRLLRLLQDDTVELRLNALKLITTLSETPTGRAELLLSLPEVSRLKSDDVSAAVRKAAQIAEKTITWKP